ncbi:reprolysin-like metallopeptidase [Hymenobacter edaphi]|uniref:reprolysin-like metallopeptidase n=1 Tax=Hymenobacter edaphi TaxID=2211146 RepID=UPI0014028E57|nr:zinc-dependent metalloprotease family protein [Hymenobacter edaphi]
MKHRYLSASARPLLSGLALLLSLGGAAAQQPAATLLRDAEPAASPLAAALHHARALALDPAAARAVLATAPPETRTGAQPLVLNLPLPEGGTQRFAVWQSSVMAPGLATRYPDIQTYAGRGLDDAAATVRLDLTPAGFHAQILSPVTGTTFIEPARRGDTQHYLSFSKHAIKAGAIEQGGCDFQPAAKDAARAAGGGLAPTLPAYNGTTAHIAAGGQLRTYRVAVATTGEYAAFHGGTLPLVLSAIVTSINRVVGVYEKELAVRLVLVGNNDQLVYLNAATDPYTNNSGSTMLGQNQTNVDNLIGTANYDIGHVFSTGGGGVAGYAVVCRNGNKARGVTGSSSPVADAFDIDYVAHEMGHQFSGSHPFNGSTGSCGGGNRSAGAAWEPGSGSTIMGYAGICGAQNLQPNSDAYFHVGNYEEMRAFIVSTPCPVTTATGNAAPVVSIPAARTLPIGTPFRLTASALDVEGDALTYSWEEIDRGSAGSPTAAQTANNNVPLFRSWVPTTSPTRYFPRLSDLVNNTVVIGERLPTVTRRLTFKCTARDQHNGPLGVIGGVGSSDSLKLPVTSTAGPFVVTAPTAAGLTWAGGSTQTVSWDVANTTAAPVSCATVNIRLSTDGGLTYPTFLARGVANSGTATVTTPSVATTTARIMVEAADNYFFDISNADFTISTASPCAPATALTISGISNTGATLSFTTVSGATPYVVTTSPATATQTVTAGPVTLSGLTPGTSYTVQVVSSCGSGSTSAAATVSFTTTAPAPCLAPSELAVSNIALTSATLSFLGTPGGGSYTITTVPATTTQTVTAGPVTLTGLASATTYVVRVTGTCTAGGTFPAAAVSFRTLAPPPANDLCANAATLTCGAAAVTGTTEGATATGDPTATCTTTVDQGGVFYRIVGTGGLITLTTCSATTNFDTKLFVFTGSCGNYTCVTGNDDASGPSCSANSVASTVSFTSTAGTTYLVMVSGWDDEVGTFALSSTCAPLAAKEAATTAFQVWPNPAGTQAAFHVTLPAPTPAGTATLRNVLGQRVAERSFSGTATEVSTAGLAPGTYLLTVQVAGQAPAVRRVVVE